MVTNAKYIEIQCTLHAQCNLNCKFCFQSNNGIRKPSTINLDYISNLPDEIMNTIKFIIEDNDIEFITLFIMGGELLSDNISDEVFDSYKEFIDNMNYLLNKFNSNIKYNFKIASNGVFTKYDRVEKLIKHVETFSLSYDPCDRFSNDHQKQMWLDTYRYFKDKNADLLISTVLTKRNINAYINGDDIFNSISSDVFIEIQDYYPGSGYNDHLPSDDDIYNFYKWCIDHEKFNITHIDIIMKCLLNQNKISPSMENIHDFIFAEEFIDKHHKYYIDKSTESFSIHDIENKYDVAKNKRGCMYCEYYEYCPKMCWDLILFKDYKITECPIKRVYQYIEDNPKIIDRYKQWRDKYGDKC